MFCIVEICHSSRSFGGLSWESFKKKWHLNCAPRIFFLPMEYGKNFEISNLLNLWRYNQYMSDLARVYQSNQFFVCHIRLSTGSNQFSFNTWHSQIRPLKKQTFFFPMSKWYTFSYQVQVLWSFWVAYMGCSIHKFITISTFTWGNCVCNVATLVLWTLCKCINWLLVCEVVAHFVYSCKLNVQVPRLVCVIRTPTNNLIICSLHDSSADKWWSYISSKPPSQEPRHSLDCSHTHY